jgi:hypothetical protein
MKQRDLWRQPGSALDSLDCLGSATCAEQHEAEQVKRLRQVRCGRQNAVEQRLGLAEPARMFMDCGLLQKPGEVSVAQFQAL